MDQVGSLQPDVGFLRWNTTPTKLWPPATDTEADLNGFTEPTWIDEYAFSASAKLAESPGPLVIGHGDWWSENIRWEGQKLLAVDDWDSCVALPEPAIAGVASALFADGESTVEESGAFLDAYIQESGHVWGHSDIESAWAAGLWARLFDARKHTATGLAQAATLTSTEATNRLKHAGL